MKKIWLITICILVTISCKTKSSEKNALSIDKNVFQSICSRKTKTVIFLWTSWCGAADGIIRRTYKPLMDSMRHNDLKMNVIMLCGNTGNDSLVKSLNLDSNFRSFYIEDPGNGFAINDRKHIRNFIEANLKSGSGDFKNEISRFGFSIPITLVINEHQEITMEHAPQDLANLLEYCSNK